MSGSASGSGSTLETAPIFIIGAARSGTTWVYDILNAHPLVHGVFESWLFADAGLGPLLQRSHWERECPSGVAAWVDRTGMIAYARRFAEALLTAGRGADERYIVEKSPSHLQQVSLITEVFPDARFIHVVRDGRDVCVSVKAAARSWVPKWRKSFGRSVLHSARAWRDAMRRGQELESELGDRVIEVRYEQLKLDPSVANRRLLEFCGIPCDDAILEAILAKTDFGQNYEANENEFRRGGRVGDWKTQLGLWNGLMFNRVAGDLLIELGYESSRWWRPKLWPSRNGRAIT